MSRTRKVTFAPDDILESIRHFSQYTKTPRKRQTKGRKTNKQHINLLYCNINGARGKIRSLKDVMTMEETDIVMLTETKGAPPLMEHFTWYSKERKNNRGGGVAIGVRNELAKYTSTPNIIETEEVEIAWIRMQIPKKKEVYIGCYYGLQEKAEKRSVEAQFEHLKTQVSMLQQDSCIIIAGDFNAKLPFDNHQEISRNGKILEEFLQDTNMENNNKASIDGMWTRTNRRNTNEKSIIDYIISNQEGGKIVENLEIDEKGTKRLHNSKTESDHNTMTARLKIPYRKKKARIFRRWKINSKTSWDLYNKELNKGLKAAKPTYEAMEKAIKQALENSVGSRIVKIDDSMKKKETEKIRDLRNMKKEKRKILTQAGDVQKKETLEQYYAAQRELRREIEEEEKTRVKRILDEIINSKDKNEIWKVRKKLLGKTRDEYDTIDENGQSIRDPEEAKEHIAKYYEDLYQAREVSEEGKEWTKEILVANENTLKELRRDKKLPQITEKEINEAKRKLKTRKSCGPDNIPNEALIYANKGNTEVICHHFNKIMDEMNVPEAWKEGRIVTVYKGKGQKGKCSNERGITISSNMGKFFERVINERTKREINISDMQGGGRKGSDTADHILALKEAIRKGKDVYIAFLDVTKAYDKAWADGIMYVLQKQGIKSKLWNIIKELNKNLTATVETKYGNTRPIKMKDNIRQGGVLSVIMYATLMDEIAKEVDKRKLGVDMGNDSKIGCLLWMDDVAFISRTKAELQEMLDIAHNISIKYRIKFGREKSKIMRIGKKLPKEVFHLGEMKLEYCEKYKYLGCTLNSKNNMEDHITETKRKTEAAYNTAMAIAGSVDLKKVELKVIWELIETCIIPIITYGWEANTPKKKEEKQLKQILDNMIKRTLITPMGTPWEPLYMETGLMDGNLLTTKNRVNFLEKVKNSQSTIAKTIRENQDPKGWWNCNNKTKMEMIGDTTNLTKGKTKKEIKKRLYEKMMENIQMGTNKTKTKYYMDNKKEPKPGKRAEYINKCTRMEASTIFKARTRMLRVKCNYKKMYQDTICRICHKEEENQEHILEHCTEIDRQGIGKVTTRDIFDEETEKLRETAKKIKKIMDKIECGSPQG